MDSESEDSEESDDHGEQCNTFDECRGDDHVGADGSGHFRLACDRLHGIAADEADAETDYSIDIEPSDAYGERDASLVETIGQNVLMRSVREPEMLGIGSPVEIGGRQGVLQFLSAGRARIDYNHPLAGVTLRYNYQIVKVVEDRDEKVQTLMKMNTGRDDFEIEFDGDDLTMTLPEEMAYDQNWAFTKFSLVTTLRENVGVAKVIFREVHEPRQIEEE